MRTLKIYSNNFCIYHTATLYDTVIMLYLNNPRIPIYLIAKSLYLLTLFFQSSPSSVSGPHKSDLFS